MLESAEAGNEGGGRGGQSMEGLPEGSLFELRLNKPEESAYVVL